MTKKNEIVKEVCKSKTTNELYKKYTNWAVNYDIDMIEDYGWIGHLQLVQYLTPMLSKDSIILDAGCGTGLIGKALRNIGYENELVGIDFCEAMLKQAIAKNCYNELKKMNLGKSLNFLDNYFDFIVSVGVFTAGHVGPEGLDELFRILKPNGKLIVVTRSEIYDDLAFKNKIKSLNFSKNYVGQVFKPMPKGEPIVDYQIFTHVK